jgi:hypothetical protein
MASLLPTALDAAGTTGLDRLAARLWRVQRTVYEMVAARVRLAALCGWVCRCAWSLTSEGAKRMQKQHWAQHPHPHPRHALAGL